MSRGKYAAKAAERNARRDTETIHELQKQLATTQKELKETRVALGEARRAINSEAMNEARRLADEEIKRCHDDLAAAHEQHREHIEALAFDLLDIYYEHGCSAPSAAAVEAFNVHYAELFGMSDRYGELQEYIKTIRARQEPIVYADEYPETPAVLPGAPPLPLDALPPEAGYMCESYEDDEDDARDVEAGRVGRHINRWERRFTSSTRKVRRANSMARQMRNGKGALTGRRNRGAGLGYANGTWGYAEKEIPR